MDFGDGVLVLGLGFVVFRFWSRSGGDDGGSVLGLGDVVMVDGFRFGRGF